MIHVVHQIRLEVPIAVAAERLADLEWLSTLNAFHRRTRVEGERRSGVGTRLVVDHGFPIGPTVPRVVRITHWEDGRRIRWTDVDPIFPGYLFPHSEQFCLTPLGEHVTLLTDELKGTLSPRVPGVGLLDAVFARLIVRRAIALQCARLRREISAVTGAS
ncbi:MAG TPA: SRPBCC family protein [Chloroflexota bacterium]|nr:SRPBCC family protein [Chloroflexota bacterium]